MIIPIRALGEKGVVTDVLPNDLPLSNSFSWAQNARFLDGRIERGPVCRSFGALANDPRAFFTTTVTGNETKFYSAHDGHLYEWNNGSETLRSPASWVASATDARTTTCFLNNVQYVNREDRTPWYRAFTDTGNFATLESYDSGELVNGTAMLQFQADWRFRSLRAHNGFLIGLNFTESGINVPQKLMWSALPGDWSLPPSNWDYASPSSLAGVNILQDMKGEIVDGLSLSDTFIVYGEKETWSMRFTGDSAQPWVWTPIFRDQGILNTNCVVELSGRHYVIDNDGDIYMHDGHSKQSLASGRIKRRIGQSIVRDHQHLAFAFHAKSLNEIVFCYSSDDEDVYFPASSAGCNRAIAWNYVAENFTSYDLPYVNAVASGRVTSGLTFDEVTSTFDAMGGSFNSYSGDPKEAILMASASSGSITRGLRTFELNLDVATQADIDLVATAPVVIKKDCIDFDDLKAELRGYKCLTSIYPQGKFELDGEPVTITVGVSDHPSIAPEWLPGQTYDGSIETYKCDYNAAGRFLWIKITTEPGAFRQFSLSGLDLDISVLGNR